MLVQRNFWVKETALALERSGVICWYSTVNVVGYSAKGAGFTSSIMWNIATYSVNGFNRDLHYHQSGSAACY